MSEQESVLVVDDDAAVAQVLAALLRQDGFSAQAVDSGVAALRALAVRPYDLVLSDVRMPGLDGFALLAEVSARHPEVAVILLTAHGTVPLAVEAMRAGAADFVLKPFDRQELLFSVRKALAGAASRTERAGKGGAGSPDAAADALFGSSKALGSALAVLDKAARTEACVLLRGESGTGKELFARALHRRSPRSKGPFIAVHCAALPEALLESELFGYEQGAFTGAAHRKPGRVELAQGGTLFLDEIGDLSATMQVKLLRLLQDKSYERLGGRETLHADVRFAAATHRDLDAMVAAREFREDLFYRLNVIPIRLPALRERSGDVAVLARHFCRELGVRHGRPSLTLEDGAAALLAAQPWPGNVRQLQNFLERLVVLGEGEVLRAADVQAALEPGGGAPRVQSPGTDPGAASAPAPPGGTDPASLDSRRRDAERTAVLGALEKSQGNRSLAARLLGVSRRTLYNKLSELGLG